MLTIYLNNLKFHAYHGLYEEEKTLGNDFEIDVVLKQYNVGENILSINQTTDYSAIYQLIKERMNVATELLETLAQHISQLILSNFPLVDEVEIKITKLNPPIVKFQGTVGINFVLKRNHL